MNIFVCGQASPDGIKSKGSSATESATSKLAKNGLYACIMIVYDRNNTGPPRGNSLNRSMTIFSTDTKRVLAGRHRK